MSEMYWITRLDGINIFVGILLFMSAVTSLVFFIGYASNEFRIDSNYTKACFILLKRFALLFALLSLLFIFIPSKKDMIMILGIGGTIDYIKSNETIKQLPDRCINALDKFLEEYVPDKEN